MMGLMMELVQVPPGIVDGREIQPGRLLAWGRRPEKMPVWTGSQTYCLGDFFRISGLPGEYVSLSGDLKRFDGIGAGLDWGTLEVEGHCGDYPGMQMRQGVLKVIGNCGDYAGAGMQGGIMTVAGDCGDFCAAAIEAPDGDMSGGILHVCGNVGNDLALAMRRGTVVISGHAGEHAGRMMRGGTVILFKQPGEGGFLQMKQGSALVLCPAYRPETVFSPCWRGLPSFYRLIRKELFALSIVLPEPNGLVFHTYRGDRASFGRGDVYVLG